MAEITILRSTKKSKPLTKRYTPTEEGPKVEFPTYFTHETKEVTDINTLHAVLLEASQDLYKAAIRGSVVRKHEPELRRCLKPTDGDPAGVSEVPRPWMMLDCDKTLEGGESIFYSNPEDGIKAIIAKLPDYLRNVSCVWHLSASCDVRKKGFRAHLWYWLDRSISSDDLKKWIVGVNEDSVKKLADPGVMQTHQPHFTADPIIEGRPDLRKGQRWGFLQGLFAEASLPLVIGAKAETWKRYLEPLDDPTGCDEIHKPMLRCTSRYFEERSARSNPEELRAHCYQMRDAADRHAIANGKPPHNHDDAEIDRIIEWARAEVEKKIATQLDLDLDEKQRPRCTVDNAMRCFEAPEWQPILALDVRKGAPLIIAEPPWGGGRRRGLLESDSRSAVRWLAQTHKLSVPSKLAWEGMLAACDRNPRDLFKERCDGLVWDGEARLKDYLRIAFGAEDSPWIGDLFTKWMISVVARTYQPGCTAKTVLVLQGEEDAKKSMLVEALFDGYFYEANNGFDPDGKDSQMLMHGPAVIEIAEIDGFLRKGTSAKSFISIKSDTYRTPHAKAIETHKRRCVFVGTLNPGTFLTEDTGESRFWPVKVRKMPGSLEYTKENADQLLAEAVHLYNQGGLWWFEDEPEELKQVRDACKQSTEDTWEDIISHAITNGATSYNPAKSPPIEAGALAMNLLQVFEHALGLGPNSDRRSELRAAKALRALGFEKTRTMKGIVWIKTACTS